VLKLYTRYIFPRLLNRYMDTEEFRELRRDALSSASGEVLEIGFGMGLNIPFYPNNSGKVGVLSQILQWYCFIVLKSILSPYGFIRFHPLILSFNLASALRRVHKQLHPQALLIIFL
jgi:hypothetical protein